MNPINDRRRHERLHVDPGFTPVRVSGPQGVRRGHTYDISESGVQFELDDPVAPGTSVLIEIELPVPIAGSSDLVERIIGAEAEVIWTDESEPGPARMAAVFRRFAHEHDRERLFRVLSRAAGSQAA